MFHMRKKAKSLAPRQMTSSRPSLLLPPAGILYCQQYTHRSQFVREKKSSTCKHRSIRGCLFSRPVSNFSGGGRDDLKSVCIRRLRSHSLWFKMLSWFKLLRVGESPPCFECLFFRLSFVFG